MIQGYVMVLMSEYQGSGFIVCGVVLGVGRGSIVGIVFVWDVWSKSEEFKRLSCLGECGGVWMGKY